MWGKDTCIYCFELGERDVVDEHGHQDGDDGHVRADQEVDEPPRHRGPLQVLGEETRH